MIVRQLNDILATDRDVQAETWTSRRLLLANDKVGFSLHDTVMKAGTETTMWYKNHIEAVYCVEGDGELEDLVNGRRYPLSPGTLYVLNGHERHIVRPKTDVRMVCVFNPPVTGRETHDDEGAYPLIIED
ncbi:ectoine synthase [Alicyclobacillus mengziensis]|uniref:L-ectoine synthase n=1 Tax=Alicyclobacillus mengziensis TaxID=2931921 RepID=A0A9X7W005_9BACL|nr:ectoine synthase [Alicyclobacillus mengziensis]QSO47849.1 ectoine synthase [Alicyclobacillus mengziensis]